MNYRILLDRVMSELTDMGYGDRVKLLKYAENMHELHSVLREYIFMTDAKVDAFLKRVKDKLEGQASYVVGKMMDRPVKRCPHCGRELTESRRCLRCRSVT